MNACLRNRFALASLGLIASLLFLAGCGQPVREDRSINWSKEGESVGFQHGQEGVFLADKDGRNLTRIFQPDPGVIATSTPLWSPSGKKVIFTTARSLSGQPPVNLPFVGNDQDPAGNIHLQQEIVYTCWLYDPSDAGKPAEPVALFEATADHPGYVAANLAVRWHPNKERIDYVKQVAPHQHGLFEYDFTSKRSRQVSPQTSEALLFDWTPDGSHLVCLHGSTHRGKTDGIWIGQPPLTDWWHVPHSEKVAPGEYGSLLENLRTTRPASTADGSRFAFSSFEPAATAQQLGRHFLHCGMFATRTVEVWAEGDQPFRDLQWEMDGIWLGVVCGDKEGSLHLVREGQPLSRAVNRAPVRRFGGWSANGEHLAYVAPDSLTLANDADWALLLISDPATRDKVFVAAGDGREPGSSVFSGIRVTFPQWSPTEDKLSLWVTFEPAYRSVMSHLLGWGLRPGDPAAVFDLKTGQLGWLPVNAQEKVQVGHYYLLKQDYAQAWHWYQEAERELPQPAPVVVHDLLEYMRALQGPRDFSIFEYYCLTRLGRADEARAKLDQFRRCFLPKFAEPTNGQAPPVAVAIGGRTLDNQLQELLDPNKLVGSLLHDLYVAEVFLSLDAIQDGEAFFRTTLAQADNDATRLSRAIVLGQILLLEKKHQEYTDLTTETVAPLLTKIMMPAQMRGPGGFFDSTTVTGLVGELALLPLGAFEFLSQLPDKQLREMALRWEKLQAGANDSSRPLLDLVLRGLYQSLGQDNQQREAETRLKNRPAASLILPVEDEVGKTIANIHAQMRDLVQRR
jgi:hypothetical protein